MGIAAMSLASPPSFQSLAPRRLPPFLLLEQLTTFRCLLSRGALLISRSHHHLFPARAVVDDDLTFSSRKLRINVGHLFAAAEGSRRAYRERRFRINNFRRRIF